MPRVIKNKTGQNKRTHRLLISKYYTLGLFIKVHSGISYPRVHYHRIKGQSLIFFFSKKTQILQAEDLKDLSRALF